MEELIRILQEYKDGSLHYIGEEEPFPIEEGKWYVCIEEYWPNHAAPPFEKGYVYQFGEWGMKVGTGSVGMEKEYIHKYFRPATEEEIRKVEKPASYPLL